MKAEILTIGDELLRGEIVDSNKAFLSDRLFGLDIETRFQVSVGALGFGQRVGLPGATLITSKPPNLSCSCHI